MCERKLRDCGTGGVKVSLPSLGPVLREIDEDSDLEHRVFGDPNEDFEGNHNRLSHTGYRDCGWLMA